MRIFLIGMPGSGKTTLGQRLSEELGIEFIDLDLEIESFLSKSIPQIFKDHGEGEFRKTETELLKKLTNSRKDFVMSTGGGVPCFFDNMDFMNESGMTIYLKVSKEELVDRLKDQKEYRPLLSGEQSVSVKITELLDKRQKDYDRAKVIIESDNIQMDDLIRSLPA